MINKVLYCVKPINVKEVIPVKMNLICYEYKDN